ncbi:hypothetical protein QTJ16_004293 [Diplocarpon rosae]|uniref:Uncharacterized protein n=1 Tax=Diplocarpon rosae TaxID=946125 RepID=A0AAD9SYD7_9HELO|nr:hypothetical protein QTJ16_004293 [Diplocarpon rosae]
MDTSDQNFQPQVGSDTTNGPHLHTYIPRADGSILVGGITYTPQFFPAATVVPTPVAASVPVVVSSPIVQAPNYYPGFSYSFIYPQASVSIYSRQPFVIPQPAYIPAQPMYQPQLYYNYHAQPQIQTYPIPTDPAFSIHQGAYGTWGHTGSEMQMQNMGLAQHPDFTKKQEMKPADDDPYRMYWCREADGSWTQRNRMTIDSGDIGDCRWYAVDGNFYCVRL